MFRYPPYVQTPLYIQMPHMFRCLYIFGHPLWLNAPTHLYTHAPPITCLYVEMPHTKTPQPPSRSQPPLLNPNTLPAPSHPYIICRYPLETYKCTGEHGVYRCVRDIWTYWGHPNIQGVFKHIGGIQTSGVYGYP